MVLSESGTLWMLHLPTALLSTEAEEAPRVLERNKIYAEICEAKIGSEYFEEKIVQTISGAAKSKEVQCETITVAEKESAAAARSHEEQECQPGAILTSAKLQQDLVVMERILMENIFQPKLAVYRQIPVLIEPVVTSDTEVEEDEDEEDEDEEEEEEKQEEGAEPAQSPAEGAGPRLEQLWSYQCDLTWAHSVSSMAWNKVNPVSPQSIPELATDWDQFTAEPVVTSDTEVEEDEDEEDEDEEEEEEKQEEGAEPAQSPAEGAGPRLEQLWSYQCDLTWAHSVSSMAWNKVNPDLLAVGYREFVSRDQKKGLACCWSLKNPMWPERVFRCEHGVTAVDFSLASPNLLAVGTADGRVAIYDVRSRGDAALLDSSASLNKHKGPVWQLRWVEQDRGAAAGDKGERLMCISGDGRVTQWFIQQRLDCSGEHLKLLPLTPADILYTSSPTKPFRAAGHPKAARVPQSCLTKPPALCTDVMKIKRTESGKKKLPGERERKSEGPISQQAAGLCFDFHPEDSDVFLAGTEEGHIYCCSCSGKEQILGTYRGHKGPVYKVAWNPSSTDVFLSCSADWSILLWHKDSHRPLLTFTSVTAFVHDIKWAPQSALVFAAVNEERVEIWDLSVSIFQPVLSCAASPEGKLSCLLFARNAECLLLGDSRGQVGVWQLHSLAVPNAQQVGLCSGSKAILGNTHPGVRICDIEMILR
ncbi:WD repeat-containing protein 78, partial [Lonchura striata]